MIVTPLAEVATFGDGQTIAACKGVLKTVNNIFTGQDGDEKYSYQKCVLTDGKVSVKLTVKNHPDMKHLAGKMVYLEASAKRADSLRMAKDRSGLVVVLTGTGTISEVGDGKEAPPNTAAAKPTDTAAAAAPAPASTGAHTNERKPYVPKPAPVEPDANERVDMARKHAAKLRNTYLICLKTALSAQKSAQGQLNYQVNEGVIQGMASSFFIQMVRDGIHHNMPTNEIDFSTYTIVIPKENHENK